MELDTLDAELLAEWAGGGWRNGAPRRISGFCNDTRRLEADQIFMALATERRDGHDYLQEAKRSGACGALVERFLQEVDLPQLVVPSVEKSLWLMAKAYRQTWSAKVVGITGSCGKTTCKDLLSSLLGPEETLCTKGNLNNLLGVPMSILRPEALRMRYAVLEAGISEPGEMGALAEMIDPDYAVITAIGPAHLEGLGTERSVAVEKGKLASGQRLQQVFAGETCQPYLEDIAAANISIVGKSDDLTEDWSYRLRQEGGKSILEQRLGGQVERYVYNGVGLGLASNVALANAMAQTLGKSREAVKAGLARWRPSALRGEWIEDGNRLVYLDSYNANPLSMNDALATFVTQTNQRQPRLFVVGCMDELGASAENYHEQLGRKFPYRENDTVLVIGPQADSVLRGMSSQGRDMSHCKVIESIEDAREAFEGFEGNVFLKGSRRYRVEEALQSQKEGTSRC